MKQAFLVCEWRNVCFSHLREKKEKRLFHPGLPGEQVSVEGGNNGRTKGKRFSNQKNAELF
jgi:hypothetical protein